MTSGWPTRPGPSPLERVSPPGAMVGDGDAPRAAVGSSSGRTETISATARQGRPAGTGAPGGGAPRGRGDRGPPAARPGVARPPGPDGGPPAREGMLHGGDLVDPEAHPEG